MRRRGVTLLEMLVAATVLSIGLLAAVEVVGRSAFTSGRVKDRARALMFARSKMEEILKEPVLQVGTDQGKGVDTTTDYDWEAAIEPNEHPSLVTIVVRAQNRFTGVSATISALRRPDLQSAPEGAAATGETAGGPAAGDSL